GSSGSAQAGTHNYVPVTMVDVRLQPEARYVQDLPDSYNGFVYVLNGAVSIGADRTLLARGQVGWLADGERGSSTSSVSVTGGSDGARLILYAGERQGVPIVQHGPFVGESRADIVRLSELYTTGKMPRIRELAPDSVANV
ncbi:MAG: pirin-like C-terminal cupin domain-containing protein, partial [Gemmatimonadaceae bacterium]